MPLGDFPLMQTTGGGCPICGHPYINAVGHGWGVCKGVVRSDETYLGVTPDQVRQIVREELQRAGLGKPPGAA